MVAVGNPVMLHFLLNVDVMDLRPPLTRAFSREMEYPAVKLNLKVNPHASFPCCLSLADLLERIPRPVC
jgi:hypothetical protein